MNKIYLILSYKKHNRFVSSSCLQQLFHYQKKSETRIALLSFLNLFYFFLSCIHWYRYELAVKSFELILSAGSVDNRFATCAAEESKPSRSAGPSSERSPTSNPGTHAIHFG
jgi:hypothetical protein